MLILVVLIGLIIHVVSCLLGYLCPVLLMLGAKMSPEKRIRGSFSAWLFSAVANLQKDFGLFSAENLIKVPFVK